MAARLHHVLCWIEVDLDAVADNVRVVQAAARPRQGVTAVVKAQAYGMGAAAVARAAVEAGARGAAVARVSEAQRLRSAGFVRAPILLLGGIDAEEARLVVDLDLTPTVTDWATAEALQRAAACAGRVLGVQVKVDTGMTRYGAPQDEAMALVRGLGRLPNLRLDGFYTHFAAADDPDPFFAHQQLARFLAICEQLEADGYSLGVKHAANSAGALRVPGAGLDTVRAGIALSGAYATGWVPRGGLRAAVSLKARVVRLHAPSIGSSIGYGRTYKVYRPMRVALIACGYADGLPRACSNRGRVLVRGQRAPLVGTVSMDMAMADVSHIPDVEIGDEVVILGRQGNDEISLDEFAESAGIIPHELLVRLGSRAPRVYLRHGEPVLTGRLACDELLGAAPATLGR
jgi:alanine racemase